MFHSQHPTNTVNASAFSARSGSSSFRVEPDRLNGTLLDCRKPSRIVDFTAKLTFCAMCPVAAAYFLLSI